LGSTDQFAPIEEAGGWWQLRRSYSPTAEPDGLVLVVKRRGGAHAEYRGHVLPELIEKAVQFCLDAPAPRRGRRKKKRR